MQEPTRVRWLKGMYVANIVVSGPIGVGTLVAPRAARGLMGVPPGDPVFYGMAAGAVPLAFGLVGVVGLRAPLRISPVLALQALYKSLFLVAVIAPLAVTGQMPGHAIPLIVIFVFFIVGNLVALRFHYLFSRVSGVEGPNHYGNAHGREGAVVDGEP